MTVDLMELLSDDLLSVTYHPSFDLLNYSYHGAPVLALSQWVGCQREVESGDIWNGLALPWVEDVTRPYVHDQIGLLNRARDKEMCFERSEGKQTTHTPIA